MELEYKGANCTIITAKKVSIAVDPGLSSVGLVDQGTKATVHLLTQPEFAGSHDDGVLVIDGPGEYEIDNVSIKGILARAHLDSKESLPKVTIYRIDSSELSVAIFGHIYPDLSEEQLEAIGVVDVVILPVGGHGYTLDAAGAAQIIRAVEPKAVVPTHYADSKITYPVPQADLETFLKEVGGAAAGEEISKLKLKHESLPETLAVYKLKRTA